MDIYLTTSRNAWFYMFCYLLSETKCCKETSTRKQMNTNRWIICTNIWTKISFPYSTEICIKGYYTCAIVAVNFLISISNPSRRLVSSVRRPCIASISSFLRACISCDCNIAHENIQSQKFRFISQSKGRTLTVDIA